MTKPRLALTIRQPFAELIMRGLKATEERSRPTKIRCRIFIYVSLGHWPAAEEDEWAEEFGIEIDGLLRGVLVGKVELYDCQGEGEWLFRAPDRLAAPVRPERHPNPVWWRPYG
jgi:hypothetical protein